MTEKLTPQRVTAVFIDCLFSDGEDTSKPVEAKGITVDVGFNPERLTSHKSEIEEMLSELPNEFQKSGGGGWSFLNACKDKNGHQWTDLQRTVEQLVLLGIGIGKVKFQLPKEIWKALPGGVPYFIILNTPKESA